ncbi:hypothetical protein OPT61_g9132 [Boeremia exigua]|uniref:Uncharacterized protein n=1 Tax=Boeremia exigua TaxID=749465 RepID=A0ACC2HVE3_9PLEO|nr:hypothetical protein OPT61_g9132 [Boeremia exigua]
MEGLFYNVKYGYIEGVVRGYRNALLTSQNYSNLTQCETIDDVKLQLSPAYGDFLASLPPNPSTSALAAKTTDKLVAEFRYVQANATGSLSKFMEYLTYGYMIDNVALLITGTLHERDTRELLERCHPLGWFETMPVLCVATNIEELYNSVLIETPLAAYFKGSLSHQDLDELNIEIIRNTLYKNYLEDFHSWINSDPEIAGTPTSDVMSEVLEFEADRRSINISLNSFGTELSKADRKKLYPALGKLHPEGTMMLSRADDVEGVRIAVESVAEYKTFFDQTGLSQGGGGGIGNMAGGTGGESRSLEDLFYQKEMEISKLAFTHQFTHAVVYAWVKLREQEIRNITWISECIAQNQKERIGNYISRPPPNYDEPYNPLPRPKGGLAIPSFTQHGVQGWWVGGEWIEQPRPKHSKHKQRSHVSPVVIDDDTDSDCFEVPPPVPQRANTGHPSQRTQFDFNNSEQAVPWAPSHPEIADYPEGRETIMHLNSSSPLGAYKYFLRGYTRPARYIDGIIKSEYFTLPANYQYQPLLTKVDPELVEFFEGFEYRLDIIERIDVVVRAGIRELSLCRSLPPEYRRLICYAIWGNPSDAYKWYEYQFQEEYLQHRYLPEHVVLGHLPKLAGEANAQPSSLNVSNRHKDVRYRMARANDQGIDVLEVLIAEFRAVLIRRGFRRVDIDAHHNRAKDSLENERQHPTGKCGYRGSRHGPDPNPAPAATLISPPRSSRKRKNHKTRIQNVHPTLQVQAAELQASMTNLERAYGQEQNIRNLSARCTGVKFNFPEINAARARAERRYVNCLIRYLRDTNQMTPAQATEMRANFTRRKMKDSGVNNAPYLLAPPASPAPAAQTGAPSASSQHPHAAAPATARTPTRAPGAPAEVS